MTGVMSIISDIMEGSGATGRESKEEETTERAVAKGKASTRDSIKSPSARRPTKLEPEKKKFSVGNLFGL